MFCKDETYLQFLFPDDIDNLIFFKIKLVLLTDINYILKYNIKPNNYLNEEQFNKFLKHINVDHLNVMKSLL